MIDFIKKQENYMQHVLHQIKEKNTPVILFGADLCGKNYLDVLSDNNIEVCFFCDDNIKKQTVGFCGKNVISPEKLVEENYSKYPILISSFGPSKLLKRLEGISKTLLDRVIWTDFYLWEEGLDYYEYYNSHASEINRAYELLSDIKSQKVFVNLLQYKICRQRSLIEEIQDPDELQYFDPKLISFNENEIFVDLGAYNGDTIIKYDELVGAYKKIYAIEPDDNNYEQLIVNTGHMDNIKYLKCGVSQKKGLLRFNSDGTWTSSVDEDGNVSIEVDCIDDIVKETGATYIKADIEGSEMDMLYGAKQTIINDYPQMAIAVYHKKEDIFTIINYINTLRDDYNYYLRHYTEMPIDSVLYVVRKNG